MMSEKHQDFLKSNKAFFPLGVGVTNFLNIQKALIKGFAVMSVVALIQIALIRWDTRDTRSMTDFSGPLAEEFTMGRYSQSRSYCTIIPFNVD